MKGARENRTADGWLSTGIFLFVLGVYLLSSPGRIDIVDGQIRFDVTQSWISTGLPELRDPALRGYGLAGRDGKLFGFYNAGPSVAGATLIWLGRTGADEVGEMQRFLFSLTSSFFGAGTIVVLYFWLRRLGCNGSRSLAYSLIAAFATYLWPLSATTFDQAQQAFLLTAALYLGWQAGVRDSLAFSAWAGVAFGCLLNYQEYFILLWPAVFIVTLRGEQLATSRPRLRVLVQLVPILIGVALLFAFNELRFGAAYFFNRQPPGIAHPSASRKSAGRPPRSAAQSGEEHPPLQPGPGSGRAGAPPPSRSRPLARESPMVGDRDSTGIHLVVVVLRIRLGVGAAIPWTFDRALGPSCRTLVDFHSNATPGACCDRCRRPDRPTARAFDRQSPFLLRASLAGLLLEIGFMVLFSPLSTARTSWRNQSRLAGMASR